MVYDKNNYSYTVPNYVKDLNFNITPEIVSSISGPGATVEVFNNTDLKVGVMNQLIQLILKPQVMKQSQSMLVKIIIL